MCTYFNDKLTYNGITFQLSNDASFDEREIHPYHEILYCIVADAMLLFENRQEKICSNQLIIIPKETYHFFDLNGGGEFTRLKISFSDAALCASDFSKLLNGESIISSFNDRVKFILMRLYQIMSDAKCEKRGLYMFSAFLMLLTELDIDGTSRSVIRQGTDSGLAFRVVEYISENLRADLSIENLSRQMHVSESAIAHEFKNKLGISIHQYVTQKRLIYAKKAISLGAQPSKIYSDCGYGDYSGFYKAYVNYFGYPPSAEN